MLSKQTYCQKSTSIWRRHDTFNANRIHFLMPKGSSKRHCTTLLHGWSVEADARYTWRSPNQMPLEITLGSRIERWLIPRFHEDGMLPGELLYTFDWLKNTVDVCKVCAANLADEHRNTSTLRLCTLVEWWALVGSLKARSFTGKTSLESQSWYEVLQILQPVSSDVHLWFYRVNRSCLCARESLVSGSRHQLWEIERSTVERGLTSISRLTDLIVGQPLIDDTRRAFTVRDCYLPTPWFIEDFLDLLASGLWGVMHLSCIVSL